MWFGKLAIISYVFSAILIGVGFMFFNALGVTLFVDSDGNNTATADYMETLTGTHDVAVDPNPAFIFGDFLAGLQAIGGIILGTATGGVIFDALSQIPFFNADESIMFMFRAVFTFSTAALIINMLTGRNI